MSLHRLCETESCGALACRGGHRSRRNRRLYPSRGKVRRRVSFRRNSWLFFQQGVPAARMCCVWVYANCSSHTSPLSFTTWKILPSMIFSNNLPTMSKRLMGRQEENCAGSFPCFPSRHLNTSIQYTSHAYKICQLTNGTAGRTARSLYKKATFPA